MNNREPAFLIGLAVSLVVAVLGVLSGSGVITQITSGKITDFVTLLAGLLTILAPVIAGLLIKAHVTPVAAPMLPVGTVVTTPNGRAATVTPV